MTPHPVNAGIFLAFAASLMFSGCSGEERSFPAPRLPATDGAFVSFEGTLKDGSRTYTADYGTISVPENRNIAGSRLIHLPVIRIHARRAESREPVFGLAGGPGQTNMQWKPPDTLLADHDFVMVGYRGVDGSTVLHCPEVAEAFKAGDDPLREESLRRVGSAWQASFQRLRDQGIDVDGYTMQQTIEDMEAARQALRYPRINLMSESYGTRVAYLYGLVHPASIHRSVMISVNPPGHFVWDAKTVDEQIRAYARLWSGDTARAKLCPDLAAALQRVLHSPPRRWLIFPVNPGKLKVTTFPLLYHRKTAAMVFDAFVAADHGDESGIALMSMAFDYVLPSMFVWGELATKGMTADFDSTRDYLADAEPPGCILGAPMNALWAPLRYARLPITPIPADLRTARRSEVETLLLSGNMDVSTPPGAATRELLPLLPNGKQIIFSEFGHVGDIRYLRPESTNRIITSYFHTGIPDTSGLAYVPMDFGVSWGFPRIAKAALSALAVLTAAIVLGAIQVARKIASRLRARQSPAGSAGRAQP